MMIKNNKNTGDIIVNGKIYSGKNVNIIDNNIFIDDEEIKAEDTKDIIIEKIENVQFITITSSNGNIIINGNCYGNCQNTNGNIIVKGNVVGNCNTINGDIIK